MHNQNVSDRDGGVCTCTGERHRDNTAKNGPTMTTTGQSWPRTTMCGDVEDMLGGIGKENGLHLCVRTDN